MERLEKLKKHTGATPIQIVNDHPECVVLP